MRGLRRCSDYSFLRGKEFLNEVELRRANKFKKHILTLGSMRKTH